MRPYLHLFLPLLLLPGLLSAQETRTLQHDGLSRSYILYQPAGHTGQSGLPLVFVLHGFTQTAQSIMNYSGFNAVADTAGFVVVYASGVNAAWNTNAGFPGGSTADDVGFLLALADSLGAELGIDPARVYACGMSAGGFMSYRLACEAADRIAAVASVTGTISPAAFPACQPERAVPVMQIHGTADLIVPFTGSQANIPVPTLIDFWVGHNACAETPEVTALPDLVPEGSTVDRIVYAPCAADTEVQLLRVNGGGHTWPGALANSGFGNTNQDISASAEIWRFFAAHTLPQSTATTAVADAVLHLYPNPVRDILTVELDALPGEMLFRLYDGSGRLRLQQPAQPGANLLDLSALEPGIYFLHPAGRPATAYRILRH